MVDEYWTIGKYYRDNSKYSETTGYIGTPLVRADLL